jgi:hypothetical protein
MVGSVAGASITIPTMTTAVTARSLAANIYATLAHSGCANQIIIPVHAQCATSLMTTNTLHTAFVVVMFMTHEWTRECNRPLYTCYSPLPRVKHLLISSTHRLGYPSRRSRSLTGGLGHGFGRMMNGIDNYTSGLGGFSGFQGRGSLFGRRPYSGRW